MRMTEYIEDKINKLPKGNVFTYVGFMNEVNRREAVSKHLNRRIASGKKGSYSKKHILNPKPQSLGA